MNTFASQVFLGILILDMTCGLIAIVLFGVLLFLVLVEWLPLWIDAVIGWTSRWLISGVFSRMRRTKTFL